MKKKKDPGAAFQELKCTYCQNDVALEKLKLQFLENVTSEKNDGKSVVYEIYLIFKPCSQQHAEV